MAFRLAAIALAVLSCTASASNVNIHNNLDSTIEYRNPATDMTGKIAPGESASVPMHTGNGRVDIFRKNPLNANAMFVHYQLGQKVLTYSVSSGPKTNPFIHEERTITPSIEQAGKNCAPIVCKEDSDKCEMKKKHCSKKSYRSGATDIDLDVEIGDSYSGSSD